MGRSRACPSLCDPLAGQPLGNRPAPPLVPRVLATCAPCEGRGGASGASLALGGAGRDGCERPRSTLRHAPKQRPVRPNAGPTGPTRGGQRGLQRRRGLQETGVVVARRQDDHGPRQITATRRALRHLRGVQPPPRNGPQTLPTAPPARTGPGHDPTRLVEGRLPLGVRGIVRVAAALGGLRRLQNRPQSARRRAFDLDVGGPTRRHRCTASGTYHGLRVTPSYAPLRAHLGPLEPRQRGAPDHAVHTEEMAFFTGPLGPGSLLVVYGHRHYITRSGQLH